MSNPQPLPCVRWPERNRHGTRATHLADRGELHCANSAAWTHWLGIAFASHPSDAERVRFFQQAGPGR